MRHFFTRFGLILATTGCAHAPKLADERMPLVTAPTASLDRATRSTPQAIVVTHLHLDAAVDVDARTFAASATLTLRRLVDDVKSLRLDAKALRIAAVHDVTGPRKIPLAHAPIDAQVDPHSFLGEGLEIELGPGTEKVEIEYTVDPTSAAFQWADAKMTSGHRPFFYTLSETAHARAWLPLQDTPGVRLTYSAEVRTNQTFLALMSATGNRRSRAADGVYHFAMTTPIPSYLVALAIGDLRFRATGPRTGVYAEPALIERARREMTDLEALVAAGERLYGPYLWGRYDVVFVPAFAFGGMENPLLSYGSTSLLVGDKSMVWLVGHEIAHSYTGNTVTNATWEDLWLNEGWTSYAEKRLAEAVFGRKFADTFVVSEIRKLPGLIDAARASDHPRDAALKTTIEPGRDPDDASSDVPYFRGELFLRRIEEIVGRPAFDAFARSYVEDFRYRSITTQIFLDYLKTKFGPRIPDELIRQWVFDPKLPPVLPKVESRAMAFADRVVERLEKDPDARFDADERARLATLHYEAKRHVLSRLPEAFGASAVRVADLKRILRMARVKNAELLSTWYARVIDWNYAPEFAGARAYLAGVTRLMLVRPVYEAIAASRNARLKARLLDEYRAVRRATYGPPAQAYLDKIVGDRTPKVSPGGSE